MSEAMFVLGMLMFIVIPALWSLRQEVHEFKASLGYTVRTCLKIF
jgi:hypothetical protein